MAQSPPGAYAGGGYFQGPQTQWSPSGRLMSPTSPDLAARAEQSMMYPVSQGGTEAFFRSMGRDMGGPFAGAIDRPHAGVEYGGGPMGFLKKLSTNIPWLGSVLKGLYAGQTANQYQGWMGEDPSQEGFGSRAWTSLASTASMMPQFNPAVGIAKNVISGIGGIARTPEFFGTSWGQMGSRLGGEAIGNLVGPNMPSQYPFFGQSPTAGGEWWNRGEGGGVGAGYSTENWSNSMLPSSFGYERG